MYNVWRCLSRSFDLADQGSSESYNPLNHDHAFTVTTHSPTNTGVSNANPENIIPIETPRRSRRRRRSETEATDQDLAGPSTSERAGSVDTLETPGEAQQGGSDQPRRKRQRFITDTMRQSFEGQSNQNRYTRGSSSSKRASGITNGHPLGNGHPAAISNASRRDPHTSFYGHDRQEVARLLIQGLQDLGYRDSANSLVRESGYELESPAVAAFRQSMLDGEWAEAESLLFGSTTTNSSGTRLINGHSSSHNGFQLAYGVDEQDVRFQLRRQKYLELLEARDHAGALMVLRQELTPLHRDTGQLHNLSGLMVCPTADDLRNQAVWDGAHGKSRQILLTQVSKAISASVMIPNHRLATLLSQVKQSQVSKCHYHDPISRLSLFTDHACDRDQFPLRTVKELVHKDEVWRLQFSHDGTRLATAGLMSEITIFETHTFKAVFTLTGHTDAVVLLAWSPDDSKLVSCSKDKTAKIWDMLSGTISHTINSHDEPVTSAAWTPDGKYLITGSLDKKRALYQWTDKAEFVHTWATDYRINALAISPDGERMVILSAENQIHVYKFHTREEEYSMKLNKELTCVTITQDSDFMLVNMRKDELQLINISTGEVVESYEGQQHSMFQIRSTFGGADETLVLTGSEGKAKTLLAYDSINFS